MRLILALALAACTIGTPAPAVPARPAPDPDRMPSSVLARQDPAADTSHNEVLSSSSAASPALDSFVRFFRWLTWGCNASGAGTGDAGLLAVIGAVALATRKRKRARRQS
jgi:MYXO-CTERM domain-containing protein